jgi:predicted outer membrane repeat protein
MTPIRRITAVTLGMAAASAFADITNITQGTTHATIQEAIDLAQDHDVIVLDPGVYEDNWIALRGKPLTLRSQDPLDPTVVAQTNLMGGYETVFVIGEGEGVDTIISGFAFAGIAAAYGAIYVGDASPTISRCAFHGNYALDTGSAIHIQSSAALIVDCAFRENRSDASRGGAITINSSTPTFRNCVFERNEHASSSGGAIGAFASTIVMESCRFLNNQARSGPAIAAWSSDLTLEACQFAGNDASLAYGSAVVLFDGSTLTADGCTFKENSTAGSGGAIYCVDGSHAALTDCRIEGNVSDGSGGGIYLEVDGTDTCSLQDSIVCANDPEQIHGTPNDLGGNTIVDITVPPAPAAVTTCPEDINGDGVVDLSDLGALLAVFDQPCP